MRGIIMVRKIFTLTLVLTLLSILTASAQTVDEILNKYYDARGGYEKLKSVNTMKSTGKQLIMGMEIPFTIQQKRPNLIRVEATVQGQTMVQGYDGKTAWSINPLTGATVPQTLPEDQAKNIVEQADIDGYLIDYKEKGHSVELIGKEEMDGTKVYKLKVTLKDGDIRYNYLDAEKFLELKVVAKIKRQGTEIDAETYCGDYKKIDGMMMAHSFETKRGGTIVSQITINSIELNCEMDDAIFKLPVKTVQEEAPKQ
jgi:outer membrane lipoprotein-sorting protein